MSHDRCTKKHMLMCGLRFGYFAVDRHMTPRRIGGSLLSIHSSRHLFGHQWPVEGNYCKCVFARIISVWLIRMCAPGVGRKNYERLPASDNIF